MSSAAPKTFSSTALEGFQDAFALLKRQNLLTPELTLEQLNNVLGVRQRDIARQIISLKPGDYGVLTPYAGDLEPVPTDLVAVTNQRYTENSEPKILSDKYVPGHIYQAYLRLSDAFRAKNPERLLLIGACYRSPAYQIIVFINWLNTYEGDIARTIRHASPPAYSQHTIASKAAIDFMDIDGSPSDKSPEKFKDTLEYAWLCQHANDFKFYESWPEGNKFGMRAEPWHWQFRETK